MSTTFVHSIKLLDRDNRRGSIWMGITAVFVLLAWLSWFLFARIPLYVTSANAQVEGILRIDAFFSPQDVMQLEVGQLAKLQLNAYSATDNSVIIIELIQIDRQIQDGLIRVVFQVRSEPRLPFLLQQGLYGDVVVEVNRLSPANLLLKGIGRRVNSGFRN